MSLDSMKEIFDRMERGEAWAAPYYAGDYLTMVEENPDLGFSHPKEGFNIFIDAMCIPTGCQNQEPAEIFINYMLSEEPAVANAEYYFPMPGQGKEKSMRLSVFADAGYVWGPDDKVQASDLRYSAGLAFSWSSPVGPLKFSLGQARLLAGSAQQ